MSAKPKPPTQLPDPNDVRSVLAYNIRLLRVQKSWSQETLAMECELDRTYVSAVERARWNISLANIDRMAKALGTQPWRLLFPPTAAEHLPDSCSEPASGSA